MQNGLCLSLKELLRAIRSKATGLSVGRSNGRMLVQLSKEKALSSFAKCTGEWVLVDISSVCDRDNRVMFVRSRFMSVGCCRT